jgi:hypothetical protein
MPVLCYGGYLSQSTGVSNLCLGDRLIEPQRYGEQSKLKNPRQWLPTASIADRLASTYIVKNARIV